MVAIHETDAHDAVWSALAHRTRRQILDALVGGPCSTGELATRVGLGRHVVIAHLVVLREADLVLTERRGRQRINYLNPVPIQQIHQRWVLPNDGPWAAALIQVRDRAEAIQSDMTGENVG